MILGRRKRHYLTSDQLQAFAFESGRELEVDKRGVMFVKVNSGFEYVAFPEAVAS